MIGSMRLLLWDCDDRSYSFYIETSTNQKDWEMVVDKRKEYLRSWQSFTFNARPIVFIKIVGTFNTANEIFHCVHFECPSQDLPAAIADDPTKSSTTTTNTTINNMNNISTTSLSKLVTVDSNNPNSPSQ